MPEQEKLARVEKDGVRFSNGIWRNLEVGMAHEVVMDINTAAESWRDRAAKEAWNKAWEEVRAEEHRTVHINCPSCGFEGQGSVHAKGVVKEIESAVKEAVEVERERIAGIVEFHRACILNPSFLDTSTKRKDDQRFGEILACMRIAAAIRAKPGKEKGE